MVTASSDILNGCILDKGLWLSSEGKKCSVRNTLLSEIGLTGLK
jgi:hypothetical protein